MWKESIIGRWGFREKREERRALGGGEVGGEGVEGGGGEEKV